jgi:hypothetical protein
MDFLQLILHIRFHWLYLILISRYLLRKMFVNKLFSLIDILYECHYENKELNYVHHVQQATLLIQDQSHQDHLLLYKFYLVKTKFFVKHELMVEIHHKPN